jgi:hypothetical protein
VIGWLFGLGEAGANDFVVFGCRGGEGAECGGWYGECEFGGGVGENCGKVGVL